ncbi:MAG: DUF4906 domain-containing protein [Bacteroides cellulosilyticus]|nr:DUF4906 domain-containing protein [Bacteroides cellulosilyticus]
MKRILLILMLLAGCQACIETNIPSEELPDDNVSVELSVAPENADIVTRTTDENSISDINLYLFSEDGRSIHLYSASSLLRFDCVPGHYAIYAVANLHRDTGDLSLTQLLTLTVAHKADYADLPMTGRLETTIRTSQGSTLVLPTLEVRRQVAKIAYDIASLSSDIELHSVRICSVPKSIVLFADEDMPSQHSADYTDTAEILASGHETSGICYLLPNPQGANPSIADQRQKDARHAPAHASYLLIQATRGDKVLTYRIYLGENNTDNFDIRRNTCHTLNIAIRGDNEVDTRISGYTVSVWDDVETDGHNGYCIDNPEHRLYVRVESNGNIPALSYTVDVVSGDGDALSVDGKNYKGEVYTVNSSNGTNGYSLDYAPTKFDSTNATLKYAVVVSDEYGFSRKFEFTHRFVNRLLVYAPAGSVETNNTVYTQQNADHLLALLQTHCSVKARTATGYELQGWYSDAECTQLVSASSSYTYSPTERTGSLYAKIVLAEHTPLDTRSTANCYIAPKKLTRYSFDATVMGNGQTTQNITPKKLSGTTAKVIWETGLHDGYNDVIWYAFYEKGRIYFATGTKYGNALIGLFDAAGQCIWSWHIWAVDYDPAENARIYSSDATFMDRNLGAMSESLTERGLYYQWGRKDPFIYPAKATSATTPATTYNLEGYPFEIRGGTGGDIHTPLPGYTIGWAAAHPTTVMVRPFKGAGYLDSWLLVPNPNLWGNNKKNTTSVGTGGEKTIYDPCPPGWKVPGRAAWNTAAFKCCDYKLEYGMHMYYNSNNTKTTFYTYNGYLSGESGQWQYRSLSSASYVWTNEAYADSTGDSSYCLKIANSTFSVSATLGQQYGCAVRCIKE